MRWYMQWLYGSKRAMRGIDDGAESERKDCVDEPVRAPKVNGWALGVGCYVENVMTVGSHVGEAGRALGKWELVERIGKGGMSEVHRVAHVDTGQVAAVKILTIEGSVNDDVTERFYHEVHILRRLKHPNILDVFEFGFEEGMGFYLVMEFLEGCTLHEYMLAQGGDLPFQYVYKIVSQVCDAMHFAHEKDIIHRDLKPENIYLCGGPESLDQVKVLDFGIAKFQLGETARLTAGGTTLGTPHYISPEQARGDVVGPEADIYSLSVILFEMLTGSTVFSANSPLEYLMRHAYTEPPMISQVRKDIEYPQALVDLVLKGLEKQPEDRPASMGQLKNWLYEAVTGEELSNATIPMKALGESKEPGSYHIDSSFSHHRVEHVGGIKPIKLGGGGNKERPSVDRGDTGLSRLGNLQTSGTESPTPKAYEPPPPAPPTPEPEAKVVEAKAAAPGSWKLWLMIMGIIGLIAAISSVLTYQVVSKKQPVAARTKAPKRTKAPRRVPVRVVKRAVATDASVPEASVPEASVPEASVPERQAVPETRDWGALIKKKIKPGRDWDALIKKKLKRPKDEATPDAGVRRRPPPPRKKRKAPPRRR